MMKYERFTQKVDSGFVSELDCRIAYNKLCAIEDKIEQGLMIDIKDMSKLFEKIFGAPCDYGMDGEEVIDVILENTDYNWCERNCNTEDYALCWEQYIKAKLKELQNG